MADGHVPLRRERRYGQHGRVGRHFGEQPSELTEYLAEYVWVPVNRVIFFFFSTRGR
jgi:hypothetical protein